MASLLGILALAIHPASPQLIASGEALELVETPSFSIYFPKDLTSEARRLASFAEAVLDSEVGRIGPRPGHRLPVLLANRFPEQNGYYSSFPSDRIVLEIAPGRVDDESSSLSDPLRGIFAHELAHALSLSTRGPLFAFGATLFGDPVAPAFWLGPRVLAEGTAIAAEGGAPGEAHGRSVDPLSAAPLLQDLVEGRRPDFWEATGALGTWPFGESPYSLGGPFAAWLEKRYGGQALARMWSELARLRPPEDFLFVKGAFTAAFGKNLEGLWSDYLDSMTPASPFIAAPRGLPGSGPALITALTAGKVGGRGLTIWSDVAEGAVFEFTQGEEGPRRLFDADGHVNRLDLSPDGRFLLVSTTTEGVDGVLRSTLLVWDLRSGAFTGRRIAGVREAAWDGAAGTDGSGGIVGIAERGIETDLVRVGKEARETLLRGGPTRILGAPVSLDDGSLALIVRDAGHSLLARLAGQSLEVLAPSVPLDNLRFLSGGGSRLLAATATPGSLYRLVAIEAATGDSPRVGVQATELSGGIRMPAYRSIPGAAAEISYVEATSSGERPADYPFDNPALALRDSPASWLRLDPSFATESETKGDEAGVSGGSGVPTFAAHPAPPLPKALSVFRTPYVSTDLDSAGFLVQGMDLTESLAWKARAGWNWAVGGADLATAANIALPPWTLSLEAEDGFVAALTSGSWWRSSSASLDLSRFFPTFPLRRGLEAGLLMGGGILSAAPIGAAYAGGLEAGGFGGRASLGWTDNHQSAFAPFEKRGIETGVAIDGEYRSDTAGGTAPQSAFSASAFADYWLPIAGLHARVEAGIGLSGLDLGPGGRFFADGSPSILAPTIANWYMLSELGLAGPCYARAELSARAFDIEIGRPFRPLWIEARRIVATAGIRGGLLGPLAAPGSGLAAGRLPVWGGTALLHSYFADLNLEFSPLVGLFASQGLSAGAEIEWTPVSTTGSGSWRLAILLGAGH
ncbi:MAG TPA: hypothetical protein VMV44_07095 [Rectinemataceae bacterium]|nr:hypothetical protein [Rectinemataceae bacterium]